MVAYGFWSASLKGLDEGYDLRLPHQRYSRCLRQVSWHMSISALFRDLTAKPTALMETSPHHYAIPHSSPNSQNCTYNMIREIDPVAAAHLYPRTFGTRNLSHLWNNDLQEVYMLSNTTSAHDIAVPPQANLVTTAKSQRPYHSDGGTQGRNATTLGCPTSCQSAAFEQWPYYDRQKDLSMDNTPWPPAQLDAQTNGYPPSLSSIYQIHSSFYLEPTHMPTNGQRTYTSRSMQLKVQCLPILDNLVR